MDEHLLAENPMRPHKGGLCIIRTTHPVAIYEVIEGHKDAKGLHNHFTYVNSEREKEYYTLRTHHFFSTDIDTVDKMIVFKFMDDAWRWFCAYMKWEDEQVDNLEDN